MTTPRPWRVFLVNGSHWTRWGAYATKERAEQVAADLNARDAGRGWKAEVRSPKGWRVSVSVDHPKTRA